ncbi:MAG: sodium:proton antiporter [Lachnospiraceae bacterium]|nr:sodium:proton antiporter [Lachnospiraceae bacterium]
MDGSYILIVLVLFPMVGAFASYAVGRFSKKIRNHVQAFVTTVELLFVLLASVLMLCEGSYSFEVPGFAGVGLKFRLDGFRAVYASVACFMWMMTSIFSVEYFRHYRNRNRYYFFMLLTLGATIGVLTSADLFTTFVFFEIMSFTSYTWVAHEEKEGALKAARTYMAVAVIGGLVMLMGLLMLHKSLGTLEFEALSGAAEAAKKAGVSEGYIAVAGILVLFGFGAKAGMFPLHIWLPKAHPVAPAPASALLSGILTKTGIFGILVISCNVFRYSAGWGKLILAIGVITMFLGALLALFSIDLKRTLACSSMSQIGFILVGVSMQCLLGDENALAAQGTVLHMINHSLIKLVLFMCAGVVFMNLHKLDLNEIRGFGRKKPFLLAAFLTGALSIGGIPGFSGYISKTLLHESIVEYIEHLEHLGESVFVYKTAEWLFLITGGMTLAYMTKLFVAVFVEKGEFEEKKSYMSGKSMYALATSAVVLFVVGLLPHVLMDRLGALSAPFMNAAELEESVAYFSLGNLNGAAISVSIAVFLYLVVVRRLLMANDASGRRVYVNRWPKRIDLEELVYVPLIERILPRLFGGLFGFIGETLPKALWKGVLKLADLAVAALKFPVYLFRGVLAFGKWTGAALDRTLDSVIHFLSRTVFAPFARQRKALISGQTVENYERIEKKGKMVTSSLSFGMVFICIGLCITLIYLLGLLI